MGRYRTKLQAIQEANKNILKEQNDEEIPGDVDNDGDVDESDEIQKELHRAITTWLGGRMSHWVSNEDYGSVSRDIMKDEELIGKKIQQIIGDVFAGTNLLGGARNSPHRGDRY